MFESLASCFAFRCSALLNMTRGASKRIVYAQLRSEQVEAGIGIGLSSIGQMLIKRSNVDFPVVVHDERNAGGRQNAERKILPLSSGNFWMAVDSASAHSARNIGNYAASWLNKVVTHPQVEAEVVVLNSFKNRFRYAANVKLIVAAQPAAPYDSPTDAPGQKHGTDLVIRGRVYRAEQVTGFERQFEAVWIEFLDGADDRLPLIAGERIRADRKSYATNADTESFHSTRLR